MGYLPNTNPAIGANNNYFWSKIERGLLTVEDEKGNEITPLTTKGEVNEGNQNKVDAEQAPTSIASISSYHPERRKHLSQGINCSNISHSIRRSTAKNDSKTRLV